MAETKTKKVNEERYPVPESVLDFYVQSNDYKQVRIVRCNQCGAALALEVLDPKQQAKRLKRHHDGMLVIELDNDPDPRRDGPLLAYRNRLDGAMGYQCGALVPTVQKVPNPNFDPDKKETPKRNPKEVEVEQLVACGNDTRVSDVERQIIPVGKHPSVIKSVQPHHKSMVEAKMRSEGYKPDIEQKDKVRRVESFTVEEVA